MVNMAKTENEKYIFFDRVENKKTVVTSLEQLSKLCGLTGETISRNLKKSHIFCDTKGKWEIEKSAFVKDEAKNRK